jgi:hypothetical protein
MSINTQLALKMMQAAGKTKVIARIAYLMSTGQIAASTVQRNLGHLLRSL